MKMYLADVFTIAVNMAGICGISVPCGFVEEGAQGRLPVGLQLIGKAFDEMTLFRAASALEKAANFTAKPPFTA